MAYDRYVAICKPLHYHHIFNKKRCVQLMAAIWVFGCCNALPFVFVATKLSFSYSHIIHQYFCEAKSLVNISSTNKKLFLILIYAELLVFGLSSFCSNLTSYIKIISAILKIKSRDGRRKAFSTCSSHITVLTIFYGTAAAVHIVTPSGPFMVLELIFTILLTVVTPVLNPLIYSLQNNDVKNALTGLLRYKKVTFKII
ncbi:olfactory receptor 1-like [Pseudophryne corroboree]|uniref:olfactory receptor 1-like n=1 Tax=Pseudophryne corroboree TaxID=495146 RepID=UPI003081A0F0